MPRGVAELSGTGLAVRGRLGEPAAGCVSPAGWRYRLKGSAAARPTLGASPETRAPGMRRPPQRMSRCSDQSAALWRGELCWPTGVLGLLS
jgi:hypothetical protein